MKLTPATLNRTYLRAALLAAGTQDVRYYLNGVLVEITRHAARIVATDGTKLAAFRDTTGGHNGDGIDCAFIIDRTMVKKVARGKLSNPRIEVTFDPMLLPDGGKAGIVRLMEATGVIEGLEVNGIFPDWRRAVNVDLLHSKDPLVPAQFAGHVLTTFADIAKELGMRHPFAYVDHRGADQTARVYAPGYPDFVGVAFPLTFNNPKVREHMEATRPNIAAITART